MKPMLRYAPPPPLRKMSPFTKLRRRRERKYDKEAIILQRKEVKKIIVKFIMKIVPTLEDAAALFPTLFSNWKRHKWGKPELCFGTGRRFHNIARYFRRCLIRSHGRNCRGGQFITPKLPETSPEYQELLHLWATYDSLGRRYCRGERVDSKYLETFVNPLTDFTTSTLDDPSGATLKRRRDTVEAPMHEPRKKRQVMVCVELPAPSKSHRRTIRTALKAPVASSSRQVIVTAPVVPNYNLELIEALALIPTASSSHSMDRSHDILAHAEVLALAGSDSESNDPPSPYTAFIKDRTWPSRVIDSRVIGLKLEPEIEELTLAEFEEGIRRNAERRRIRKGKGKA
ncbi:hypothetical protein BDN70DRAFT_939039 [Pholiota conissans]|uniref:Uncharacterized protein n=1 Tax=Pholiota conissans TaxID=109636 RepID=A0A9P5YMK1_9AGAR|nr:hypothetical protein BDN70DRAFT_939039 [Pholiota conissans]